MVDSRREAAVFVTLFYLGLYSTAAMISDCRSRNYEQQLQEPRIEK